MPSLLLHQVISDLLYSAGEYQAAAEEAEGVYSAICGVAGEGTPQATLFGLKLGIYEAGGPGDSVCLCAWHPISWHEQRSCTLIRPCHLLCVFSVWEWQGLHAYTSLRVWSAGQHPQPRCMAGSRAVRSALFTPACF